MKLQFKSLGILHRRHNPKPYIIYPIERRFMRKNGHKHTTPWTVFNLILYKNFTRKLT